MNDRHCVWVALFVLLVTCLAVPALSQSGGGDATVRNVTYAGDATADPDSGELRVWQRGSHRVTVDLSSSSGVDDGDVCLSADRSNATSDIEIACERVSVSAGDSESITLSFQAWPDNATDSVTVRAAISSADGVVLDRRSTRVTVLRRDGDLDDDGLTNERETELGTDLGGNDTDGDGLDDGLEVGTHGTVPTTNDTDDDGLLDPAEIRVHGTGPTVADTDGDGLADDWEVRNATNPNVADTDGDGLDDALEVNTYETNATVPDTDADGLDDGAEVRDHGTNPNDADTDGDGLDDNLEVHTYRTDPNAIDTDDDGLQDGDEVFEHRTDPTTADTDGDGLSDGEEINIYETNPRRADTDGDGLDDGAEVRRFETDPNAADTDGDGVSDREAVGVAGWIPFPVTDLLFAGALLVTVAAGILAYRLDRSSAALVRGPVPASLFPFSVTDEDTEPDDPGTSSDATARPAEEASTASVPGADDSSSADSATADGSVDGNAADGNTADGEPANLDLLPNTDRILAVLEANGGQMRQSALVEETGWSKAKVSRVLSEMEDDGQVVKVSVGRGNLITTPNDVPSGAKSPFDE